MRQPLEIGQERILLDCDAEDCVLPPGDVRMLKAGAWFVLVVNGSLEGRGTGLPAPIAERCLAFLPLKESAPLRADPAVAGSVPCRFALMRVEAAALRALEDAMPVPVFPSSADDVPVEAWPRLSRLTGACAVKLSREDALEFAGMAKAIAAAESGTRDSRGLMAALAVMRACTLFAAGLRERNEIRASGVWSMEDAVNYIDTHYAATHSLEDMVRKCALNTTDFSRLFKERAGYPLFEYINRARVKRACFLLRRSALSVTEVALSVGYNNVSFFNRYFMRIMRMTPTEWRNGGRNIGEGGDALS